MDWRKQKNERVWSHKMPKQQQYEDRISTWAHKWTQINVPLRTFRSIVPPTYIWLQPIIPMIMVQSRFIEKMRLADLSVQEHSKHSLLTSFLSYVHIWIVTFPSKYPFMFVMKYVKLSAHKKWIQFYSSRYIREKNPPDYTKSFHSHLKLPRMVWRHHSNWNKKRHFFRVSMLRNYNSYCNRWENKF